MTVIFMIHFDAGSIDPSSITPMYKQVAGIISEGIRTGELKVGEKLPSEFELMKDFNVSRVTIRGAISELVTDGLLVRSQGKGTFVAPQKKLQSANDTTGLTDSCRQAGKVLKSQVLSVEYAYPTHADSEFLAVDESQQVIEIKRLRYIDGHPSILETLYFPRKYDFLLHENLEGSVFSILHAHGITVHNSRRTLEISNASSNEAGLLEIKRNSPPAAVQGLPVGQPGQSPVCLQTALQYPEHDILLIIPVPAGCAGCIFAPQTGTAPGP